MVADDTSVESNVSHTATRTLKSGLHDADGLQPQTPIASATPVASSSLMPIASPTPLASQTPIASLLTTIQAPRTSTPLDARTGVWGGGRDLAEEA